MEVQTKAIELATYTINNALKDKIIPKRDRWALGSRLVDTALELATHIDTANTLRLDNAEEAKERSLEQRLALSATFRLMTLIHIARQLTHFPEDTHLHWATLVNEVQTMLRAWIDSDRRRKSCK